MAIAVKEREAITTNKLAQMRNAALALMAAAYTPQPVPQPDGTTLALCWNGRIARAYERLAAARIARDAKIVGAVQEAIRPLEQKAEAAFKAAEDAASAWAAAAAAAGVVVQPNEVYPPPCACAGCRTQRAYHDHNEARGAYSDALYALLAPTSHETPPLLAILAKAEDEAQRDRLWAYLKRIRDAGDAYIAACKAADTRPNWRAALFPGEDA